MTVPAEIIVLDMRGGAARAAPIARPGTDSRVVAIMLPAEIAEHVEAALAAAAATEERPLERFRFGRTWLEMEAARLVGDDGREVPLTAMEFNLLKLFARNRGRVLSRDQILEGAHDRPWDPFDRSIDIRVSRIRRKIEVNPTKPEVIRTVRGIGYVYDPR
jgi:two-component system phosphate regulon response regulator OmpR